MIWMKFTGQMTVGLLTFFNKLKIWSKPLKYPEKEGIIVFKVEKNGLSGY
jgi:hypothetical protein